MSSRSLERLLLVALLPAAFAVSCTPHLPPKNAAENAAYRLRIEAGPQGLPLMGRRFLTLNTVIRVNQIEVARDRNEGVDERALHTPARVVAFREAVEKGFPGARITWAFSWLAIHDPSPDYAKIREIVAGYHRRYGDEITFIPGGYFANAYNSTEQVN
ncbi:MAG TPA: DUF3863 domain-containing protein, partial [Thermoanaerobaculia bacterium]|nr:DUF3863 domain-containing protein [Thermoanaerobaculia bacterium]